MTGNIFLIAMTLADVLFILSNQFFVLWFLVTFDLNLSYISDWTCKFIVAFFISLQIFQNVHFWHFLVRDSSLSVFH